MENWRPRLSLRIGACALESKTGEGGSYTKQLRLAVKTEEERRTRLDNVAATKRLRLAMETDEERKARLEKMVATAQLMLALIKGVVDVGVVFVPQTHSEKLATMLIIQT